MKRSIIVCCALACLSAGSAFASIALKLAHKAETAAAGAGAKASATTGYELKALGEAQDRAVRNYKNKKARLAAEEKEKARDAAAAQKKLARAVVAAKKKADAAAKGNKAAKNGREQAGAKTAAQRAAAQAKKEAVVLAKAQDRVVAYYKRSLGIDIGTTVAKAVKRIEKLACFTGVRDRHARIGVKLVNGKVDYFAYYSKWKPRTCSIAAERNGPYSTWEDHGNTSEVTLVDGKGVFTIKRTGGTVRFVFHNIDRMRYCGMSGKINGSLTVSRGRSTCVLSGVMDAGEG